MHIKLLRVENFRNLKSVHIEPHPRLNFFYGDNGAGKTSLLEALVVVSRGKSFKTAHIEELSGADATPFRVFLESRFGQQDHKIGLERSGKNWKARLDGQDVPMLSVLTRQLPMVLMEPNSHLLISGSPEGRRRFLDWGVFHVEPLFLDCWRRYARVLKQRNAALRAKQVHVLDSLDHLAATLGEQLNSYRLAYFHRLVAAFLQQGEVEGAPELKGVLLGFQPGWKGESLLDGLARTRSRDLETGATGEGPHRADVVFSKDQKEVRSLFSRGEQKSLVASLLLKQAELLASQGEPPLVLLDDLASEFDEQHFASVLLRALACAGQVWVTGTSAPAPAPEHKVFHVKHGGVQELL
jgi:DNA replication and repair protein RecF